MSVDTSVDGVDGVERVSGECRGCRARAQTLNLPKFGNLPSGGGIRSGISDMSRDDLCPQRMRGFGTRAKGPPVLGYQMQGPVHLDQDYWYRHRNWSGSSLISINVGCKMGLTAWHAFLTNDSPKAPSVFIS